MKTLYLLGGNVVGTALVGDGVTVDSGIPDAISHTVEDGSPVSTGWTYTVTDDGYDFTAPAAAQPRVSPVEFKLLFTAPERVAIKAARATDPMVDDFYDVVEDPRLTHVDLGLQSTRDAVDYLIAQSLVSEGRRDAILSGVLQ